MTAPRFSMVLSTGHILDQHPDNSWTITSPPSDFGFATREEMQEVVDFVPGPEPLADFGFAATGPTIAAIITGLVMATPAYRDTLRDVGGTMLPISNQPWCPDADEHVPHVQCAECQR